MSGFFDWTDAAKERLRELWASPHSTSEIGAMIGPGKNSIVGMAHRLQLPPRPSPIRPPNPNAAAKPKRAAPPRLPTLKSVQQPLPTLPVVSRAAPRPVTPPPVAMAMPPRALVFKPRGCAWPLWSATEWIGTDPRYCGASVRTKDDGKPCVYCAEHAARAFVSVRRAS